MKKSLVIAFIFISLAVNIIVLSYIGIILYNNHTVKSVDQGRLIGLAEMNNTIYQEALDRRQVTLQAVAFEDGQIVTEGPIIILVLQE